MNTQEKRMSLWFLLVSLLSLGDSEAFDGAGSDKFCWDLESSPPVLQSSARPSRSLANDHSAGGVSGASTTLHSLYLRFRDLYRDSNHYTLNQSRQTMAHEVSMTEKIINSHSSRTNSEPNFLDDYLEKFKNILLHLEYSHFNSDSADLISRSFRALQAHTSEALVASLHQGTPRLNLKLNDVLRTLPLHGQYRAIRKQIPVGSLETEIDIFEFAKMSWIEVKDWTHYGSDNVARLEKQVGRHRHLLKILKNFGLDIKYKVVFTGTEPSRSVLQALAGLEAEVQWIPISERIPLRNWHFKTYPQTPPTQTKELH